MKNLKKPQQNPVSSTDFTEHVECSANNPAKNLSDKSRTVRLKSENDNISTNFSF